MRGTAAHLAGCVLTGTLASAAIGGETVRVWTDPLGDAAFRHTTPDGASLLRPGQTPPDLLEVRLSAWEAPAPAADPFTGAHRPVCRDDDGDDCDAPHLFRLDLVLAGVVNPPGSTGSGAGGVFQFGPNPIYGAIEVDVDQNRNTGGEMTGAAGTRFLANIGRFGLRPRGNTGSRAVTTGPELDGSWPTSPQFERSGADFALLFCGCSPVEILHAGGNGDTAFEAGETWIVRGRFWQRAGGYRQASTMIGGSGPGAYDPLVRLRFSHDPAADRTTISLVYALDMEGARLLANAATRPPVNTLVDIDGNPGSMLEALTELVAIANRPPGMPATGLARELISEWDDQRPADHLDPTDWRPTALFGTAYESPQGLFAWSDAGFDLTPGDVNGDGAANDADRAVIAAHLNEADGTSLDADGVRNGVVHVPSFPSLFSLYDVNGDGRVDQLDLTPPRPPCRADFDEANGLQVADIFAFLRAWFANQPSADFDQMNGIQVADIFAFLRAWFAGCP